MRFNTIALAAAAVSFILPAAAQTADPAQPAPKKEKKICRHLDQTGSILGSRPICHTKEEWASIDSANDRNASRALDEGRRVGSRANGSF